MSVIHNAVNDGEITIADVSEPLTSKTARMFERDIDTFLVNGRNRIIINAAAMPYISSEGIGALVYATRSVSLAGGVFVACFNSAEVIGLLKAVGIYDSLTIVHSVEQGKNIIRERNISAGEKKLEIRANIRENIKRDIHHTGTHVETETVPGNPPLFENPLVIECAGCGSFTRVHRAGDYICPTCHAGFAVEEDGTVVF
jgi:anti-anti-sigma factor